MKDVELKTITLRIGDNEISFTEAEARAVYAELGKLFEVKVQIQREYYPAQRQWDAIQPQLIPAPNWPMSQPTWCGPTQALEQFLETHPASTDLRD